MTTVYISPNKHIYIKVVNPENRKVTRIYTGYTADQPEAFEKVTTIKEKIKQKIEESSRYLRF